MNVFELFGTIAINNMDAHKALDDTSTRAERTSARINEAFKKIGSASIKIGKAVVGGATAIGTAFAATVESTRDYRTSMAQLETAFLTNGFTAAVAKKTYQDLQAVLGETDQSVEAANHLAVLCDNEEDLEKWTDICTGVFATFTDSLPIEGLTESANETAKVGQVTGSLADALNWAGISEEDFNKKLSACTTEEERQDLIMNTLYWTYKKASDQYKDTAGEVMAANTAQDKLNGALATLGEIGEPVMSGLKSWIADMVTAAAPHLQNLVTKLVNFNETMANDIWPWIQNKAEIIFGVKLPDWETFKEDVATWWTETGPKIADTATFLLRCVGIGEWTEEDTERLRAWWDGVYAKAVEVCKWVLDPPDLPSPEAMLAKITAWWDSFKGRINLSFGIKPHIYNADLQSVSTGSDVMDAYMQSTMVNPDAPWAAGLKSLFSHASGLDYVPHDGYAARLHKGEAVLTSAEATAWRGGGNVEALLAQIVANTGAGKSIVLDSGVLVGQLAPGMDAQLGTIMNRKRRGN